MDNVTKMKKVQEIRYIYIVSSSFKYTAPPHCSRTKARFGHVLPLCFPCSLDTRSYSFPALPCSPSAIPIFSSLFWLLCSCKFNQEYPFSSNWMLNAPYMAQLITHQVSLSSYPLALSLHSHLLYGNSSVN